MVRIISIKQLFMKDPLCARYRGAWVKWSRDPYNSPLRVTLFSPPCYGWALSLGEKSHNSPKAILLLRDQLGCTPTLVPEPVMANGGRTSCSVPRTAHDRDTANPWDLPFSPKVIPVEPAVTARVKDVSWAAQGVFQGADVVVKGSNDAQNGRKETGLGGNIWVPGAAIAKHLLLCACHKKNFFFEDMPPM